jgi:hypothetical protein
MDVTETTYKTKMATISLLYHEENFLNILGAAVLNMLEAKL